MEIWPAIDLRGGKCVRLQQGDYDRETVFDDDPVATARRWVDQGARRLHLVDLDGAREGRPVNGQVVASIVAAVDVPCQLGGGIRDRETIAAALKFGVARLVIGTRAIKEPDWFRAVCREFPGKLVLGVDAREGRLASDGWLEESDLSAAELLAKFHGEPIAAVVYTDIGTDGMLAGPNVAAMEQLSGATDVPLIASGGVTTADDVAELVRIGVAGCIIGRALYEGRLTLPEALAASRQIPN